MNNNFLEEAVSLSKEKSDQGLGGPFGAVVVKNEKIVGRGWNAVLSEKNPTLHAEIMAIENACKYLGTHDLSGCVIYSSTEPCPMCLGAIYWAHLDEIFYATTRDDAADIGFNDKFIYNEMELPSKNRKLRTEQVFVPRAKEILEEWGKKEDSIIY